MMRLVSLYSLVLIGFNAFYIIFMNCAYIGIWANTRNQLETNEGIYMPYILRIYVTYTYTAVYEHVYCIRFTSLTFPVGIHVDCLFDKGHLPKLHIHIHHVCGNRSEPTVNLKGGRR